MPRDRATVWAGVDVGAAKGFDAAAVDSHGVVAGPSRLLRPDDVAAWARDVGAGLVAVDSPRAAAPPGARLRDGERGLARAVCGVRWTPDHAALEANSRYYGWVLHGFELYAALEGAGLEAVECFPTAAWTRWAGGRAGTSRATWSRAALGGLGVGGVPERTSQDARDAIAAALTARLHAQGRTESFGGIAVPTTRP